VVAFHHTSTQNLVTFGDRVDPAQAAILEVQSRGERALYDELGIDPRALLWPGMSTNVLCVGPVSGNAGEWDVVTQVGWTILSRAAAEALRGHPFQGWWPSTRDEVRASLARIGGAQLTFVSNISMPEWGSFDDMVAYLRRKPTCNTETGNPF
jgi:hypothetical protein